MGQRDHESAGVASQSLGRDTGHGGLSLQQVHRLLLQGWAADHLGLEELPEG